MSKKNVKRLLAVLLCMVLVGNNIISKDIFVNAAEIEKLEMTTDGGNSEEGLVDVAGGNLSLDVTENGVAQEDDSNVVDDEGSFCNAEERLALMTAEDDIASGFVDEDYGQIAWVIDANGKLTVEGTGDFAEPSTFWGRGVPWNTFPYYLSITSAEINVSGMTDASYMFYRCSDLKSVDLSNFTTDQITNMAYMFSGQMTSLDLSGFDTSSVTDMSGMFSYCGSLTSLDLSGFDTSKVTDMSSMFYGCNKLTSLDVSNFNTSKVTDMIEMFSGCESLISLDLSGFDTGKVTDMYCMFSGCGSLTSLDLSGFDTSKVTDMTGMFSDCHSLLNLDVSNFDTRNVVGMGEYTLAIDWDPIEVVPLGMFSGCSSLTELNLSNFDTSNVTNMWGMFHKCSNLVSLDLSNFDTGQVIDMAYMFYCCDNLESLDVSNFDTRNVTDICGMFGGCRSLEELNLSSFNLNNASDTNSSGYYEDPSYNGDIFTDCASLSKIYAPCNLKYSVPLPVGSSDIWYRSDGITVTELPPNLSYSIVLGRNDIPKEKDDSASQLSNSEKNIFLFRNAMTGATIKKGRVRIEEEFSSTNVHYYSPVKDNGFVEVPLSKKCNRVFISTYFDGYEGIGGWADLNYYRSESGIYIFDLNPRTENYICKMPQIKTSVKTSGPDVETDEGVIRLFDMDMDFALDFGKGVTSTVTYDESDRTIKVAISTEGKVSYDKVKKECKASGSKSGKSLAEKFESADDEMKTGKFSNVDVKVTVNGYLEFAETGEFIEGGAIVKVKGSGEVTQRHVYTAGLTYAKYELGLSTEGKLIFKYVEGNIELSGVIKYEPYAKIAVGAGWSLAHSEIGAVGKFPIKMTIPYIDDYESLNIDADFEVYGEVKFFCNGVQKPIIEVEGNIWPAMSFHAVALNAADLDIDSDDLGILPRDYLASNSKSRTYNTRNESNLTSSDSFRYSEISEDKGVFEENNVQYVMLSDGTEILAWIHDFGDKSSANRTTLVYSVNKNDGNGWSSITPVCSDTSTGDYYPHMAADGDKAYLVWNKASKEFSDDVSIEDICNNMDVYVSVFVNGAFSEPLMISDANNGLVEFSPMVAVNGDSAAVAWMTNSVNDYHYTKGENSIYVCEYKDGVWGNPVCYAQNLNYVSDYDMDYVNGSVAVLYAEDADNISDTQDGCVYYVRNGNKSMVGDASYNAEIVDFCDGMIYFSSGSRIYKTAANNLSYIYDTGIEASNFSVLKSASGAETVMFLKQDGFESNLYVSYYRNGMYTLPVPVVADGSRVTNYSPIYNDDGTISIAYNEEEILENSDYIYGLTDMVIKKNVNPNLFFVDEDLAYNAYDVTSGNTIEFATIVSNYTNNAVSKVKVSLSGSNAGEVRTAVLDVDIPVGERKYVSIPYTLPDHIVNQRYILTVTPVDFDDTDLSDNTAVCELGFSDIAFSDLCIDNNTITGKITNIGYQAAENVSLTIKEDNQENTPLVELFYGEGDLAVGESWEFSQEIEPVEFKNVGDVKYYLLSAQTDSLENNYANDSEIVYSVPVVPESISLNNNTLSLTEKTTAVINAEVLPENATFKNVVYISSDNSVVIVDSKGKVYAVGEGSATVTAYTLDGSQSAKCDITVEGLEEEKYVLSERELELEIGSEGSLCVKDENEEVAEGVTWSSTDEDIVTIKQDGTVVAKGEGIAYLVAEIDTFTDVCIVRVSNYSIVQLACEESSLNLTVGETSQLDIVIIPENTTMDKTLTYTSDDETVATVSASGLITAVASGSTVVTVFSVNGIQKKIEVVVDAPMTYTVAFDSRGGTSVDPVEVTVGKVITEDDEEYVGYLSLIPKTYKEGYSFAGWYTDKNGTGEALTTDTPITGDIIYYAKWLSGGYDDSDDDSDTVLPEDIPADGIPEGLWIAGIDSAGYTYTGKAIKPTVRVYDGNKRLKVGQDYTLSYKNNTKVNDISNAAKAPTVIVKGKGNYGGKETATFVILPMDLKDISVIAEDMTVACDNKLQKKVPILTYNGKKLSNKKDFTVSYPALEQGVSDAYKAVGTYYILLTAKEGGNFTGTRTVKLTITDSILISKAKVSKISDQLYTGNVIEPGLTVTYNNTTLELGTDYTVTYANNTEVGTATAILTGIGAYAGAKKVTFKIAGTSIKKAVVTGIENKVYNGSEQKPEITVTLNNAVLTEGSDYELAYAGGQNVGKASVTIKGINAYTGTIKKSFKIIAYDLQANTENQISGLANVITVKYVKGGSKPEVGLTFAGKKLTEGMDYKVSYRNNKAVTTGETQKLPTLTIKGKGNFKGTLSKTFTITSKALDDADSPVTLSVADKVFVDRAGKYISNPILTDSDGKKLIAGKDYEKEISYSLEDGTPLTGESIVNVGSNVKVRVTGKGAYYGELEKIYRITEFDFSKAKIKIAPKVYTGSPITLDKTDISVTIGEDTLIYGTDYEVIEDSYTNNKNKGSAKVTIIGKGKYGGMKTSKFKITTKGFLWFWRKF